MAKIKLRFLRQTPEHKPGDIVEIDREDRNALRWVKDHMAEVVPEEPPEATQVPAEPPPPETKE